MTSGNQSVELSFPRSTRRRCSRASAVDPLWQKDVAAYVARESCTYDRDGTRATTGPHRSYAAETRAGHDGDFRSRFSGRTTGRIIGACSAAVTVIIASRCHRATARPRDPACDLCPFLEVDVAESFPRYIDEESTRSARLQEHHARASYRGVTYRLRARRQARSAVRNAQRNRALRCSRSAATGCRRCRFARTTARFP